MKKPVSILVVAAVAAAAAWVNVSRGQDQSASPADANRPAGSGTATSSPSTPVSGESSPTAAAAPLSPAPDISLEVNSLTTLDLRLGTPLLLTVRLGNQQASNALSTSAVREALAADAREKLKAGKMTAAESQAREAFAKPRETVPTLVLPTNWPKSVHFEVRQVGNTASQPEWPFSLLAAPAAQPMVLDGTEPATATWGLSPEAAAGLRPGSWQVEAILDTSVLVSASTWQGRVVSAPVTLNIKPRPASAPAEEAVQDNIELAHYHAAAKQWDKSLAAARSAAQLNPNSIEAHTLIGDALAGTGDNGGAMKAFQTALTEFEKQNPNARENPEYLIERMQALSLASPLPGLAPKGTIAPPPPEGAEAPSPPPDTDTPPPPAPDGAEAPPPPQDP
jgi:tetratricopeptide (TPR) repeat protein